MFVRRLVATLTSVTLLHLAVAAGDSVCATYGAYGHHADATHAVSMTASAMPMDGHAAPIETTGAERAAAAQPAANPAPPPCETPVQRHCCDALLGCGIAGIAAADGEAIASIDRSTDRVRGASHDAPASFVAAPEPPPPRA